MATGGEVMNTTALARPGAPCRGCGLPYHWLDLTSLGFCQRCANAVLRRLIPAVRIPLTPASGASDFQSDGGRDHPIESPIRTNIRTGGLWRTLVTHGFSYAPRVIRTPALLIRSHTSIGPDTQLRGVRRGDALANAGIPPLATPQSGHTSGRGSK